MHEPLRTCSHIHETGDTCNSVAAKHQKYCPYHLRYRARQLRMAQMRARWECFHLQLPPLESMYAVQSALSQLAEALAADMIEPKRANSLLSVLRLMSLNFRHPEKWQTNLYHSDQPAEIDIAQEFGLPRDLDLDTPPEVAFPANEIDLSSRPEAVASHHDLSSRAQAGASPAGVEGSAFPDSRPPTTDNLDFRPDSPVSPEFLELRDITRTQGADAANLRFKQLERNRARRELHSDSKRYADLALRLNLKKAAERMAERKVAEKLAEAGIAPAPANAEPLDFDSQVAEGMKKSAAAFAEIDACLAAKEVKIA
jgi:hypothetical protein